MRNLKKVLSLTLALVMLIGMMVVGAGATSFKDDKDIADEYKVAAAVLDEIGVMNGTELNGETNFNPKKALTRVEGAALIYRVFTSGLSKNPAGESGFTDVDGTPNHGWASGTVAACRDLGIVSGVSPTSFNPGGELTGSAFAKMLLVTLGYESDKQGYEGEGWAANVARDARTRGILLEAQNMNTVLTREEAAQMTLQALTADTMEYTGMNITTPDGTSFSTPATVRKYDSVNGNLKGQTYNGVDITPATTPIKLCEEKFPALKLTNTEDETFGRAQEVWTWKNVEITGTKTNVEPDAVFTAETKESGVKKEIGKAESNANSSLFINGQKTEAWDEKDAADIASLTGNGRVVEVYRGKDNKALITKVVVVDTALGEVTKVDAKNEKITIKLERVDSDKTVEDAPALTTEIGYGEFKKGDIVLVQGWYNGATGKENDKLNSKTTVTSVVEAPKVVGLARQKNYSDTTITVDGEARKMSYGWVKDYGFADFAVNNTYDCTLYLDNYDNIIKAIKGAKSNVVDDNLIAVNDAYTTIENGRQVWKVSGTYSNGETDTLTVPSDQSGLIGFICTYTERSDGKYNVAKLTTHTTTVNDKKLYVSTDDPQEFNSKDSYSPIQANGQERMYADDVKFIFVESDGNTTVLNGRQTQSTSNGTVVAQALRDVKGDGSRYEIIAVFIANEPDVVDISDIIFVHKGSSEDSQVSDDVVDDKDGSRKTIYGYVAYDSNGEPIENFYGTKANMAHKFFKKSTTTIGDYTVHKNTTTTSLYKHTVADATVVFQNGLRGDAFVLNIDGDNVRFLGGGAKIVDLSGKWIEDISELNEMADENDVVISVIYNDNSGSDTKSALTIFVESVTEKKTSPGAIWGTGDDEKDTATLPTVNAGETIRIPAGKTLTISKDLIGTVNVKDGGKLIVKGDMDGEVTVATGAEVEVKGEVTGKITAVPGSKVTIDPKTQHAPIVFDSEQTTVAAVLNELKTVMPKGGVVDLTEETTITSTTTFNESWGMISMVIPAASATRDVTIELRNENGDVVGQSTGNIGPDVKLIHVTTTPMKEAWDYHPTAVGNEGYASVTVDSSNGYAATLKPGTYTYRVVEGTLTGASVDRTDGDGTTMGTISEGPVLLSGTIIVPEP